jgi:multicomponent Na+:H+ antiporter subunit B
LRNTGSTQKLDLPEIREKIVVSLILSIATRYLLPLLLLLSVYLLLRGHDAPGGGFIGGLVASSAFALYAIAHGAPQARRALRIDPGTLIALGLLAATASASLSLLAGLPFMTSLWMEGGIPAIGKIGTPLIFDTGVFMVVVGVNLMIILSLMEH